VSSWITTLKGGLAGIDIDNASRKMDLQEITLCRMPAEVKTLVA
jgi:hypothetical protein